eukprot:CAMPEP_0197035000 /NCGR_PEP_ID=MMETSP1384-20130603/12907_1 /TAXON_ID=29189 /ORGANISM="Ammonia sp." /LENGTH=360 /DNA_ID=CAMNT_0042464987 /DNA_START=135 /DNA_END=1217 /DNA_ORIENTATION=-
MSATSNSSTTNSKKRPLQEAESDDDSDDQDLVQSEPVPHKKRKLNEPESNTNNNKNDKDNDDEEDDENEDDDLKSNSNSPSKSPSKSASSCAEAAPFKICCYNINGIRAAAKNGLEQYIEEEDADIVCFSETKAKKSQNPCKFRGYEQIWCECTDKAGYSGTLVLSKQKPIKVMKGIGCQDGEGRAITLEFDKFYLVNTYVPNSGQNLKFKKRRLEWDAAMKDWLQKLQATKPIIWTGDLNVAILDFDVYDGETNKKREKTAGFTPYERENFRKLTDELTLVDSYRHFYPNEREKHYTFFTARARGTNMKKENKGWRLDYFMVSKSLINIVDDVQIRKEKACSDHVPLILMMKDPKVALS